MIGHLFGLKSLESIASCIVEITLNDVFIDVDATRILVSIGSASLLGLLIRSISSPNIFSLFLNPRTNFDLLVLRGKLGLLPFHNSVIDDEQPTSTLGPCFTDIPHVSRISISLYYWLD